VTSKGPTGFDILNFHLLTEPCWVPSDHSGAADASSIGGDSTCLEESTMGTMHSDSKSWRPLLGPAVTLGVGPSSVMRGKEVE
jgi:hypothetical protein